MGDGVQIGGSVERSVVIQGDGNHVTLIVQESPAAATRPQQLPYEFDRNPQKEALRALFGSAGAGVVSLHGPNGEGHGLVAEYLFQSLLRTGRVRRRVKLGDREWPRGAPLEARIGELCEHVARRWFQPAPAILPRTPAELVALVERARTNDSDERLIVHHALLVPTREDARLLDSYLELVWKPLFSRAQRAAPATLVFEFHLARRANVVSWLYRTLGIGDYGSTRSMLARLGAFARETAAVSAPLPELEPISEADLAILYPHPPDADPAQVRLRARALHQATLGRFDSVVAQLFPVEAI